MSIIFPSVMFKQSETLLMKGYYIYHRMLTALKHVSVHNSQGGKKNPSTLFFTHLQFL